MGQLIEGVWHAGWYAPDEKGAFKRPNAQFRSRLSRDGSTGFGVEAGRYHLYASYACPWAHRVLITRSLRGLEKAIPATIVDPKMGDDGWQFTAEDPDPLFGAKFLREIYVRANARYSGRVTVPVLWDKKTGTIVNNESREVMRMLDVEFDELAQSRTCLAPPELRAEIDANLDRMYSPINNGVYRAGFATTQGAYEEAVGELFTALDAYEALLEDRRFVCGEVFTEADIALFTTLFRFDIVYNAHFKCNVRRIQDYPNLWGFVRDVYQKPEVRTTCDAQQIKTHYYFSQTTVNPHRIVPVGPTVPFDAPHDRATRSYGKR